MCPSQFLNYLGNLGIVQMAMEREPGRELVAQALAGLLARGLPLSHVWVQKFRKHLTGTPPPPAAVLVELHPGDAVERVAGGGGATVRASSR